VTSPEDEFFGLLHEAEGDFTGDSAEADELADPAAALRAQCDEWIQAAQQIRYHPEFRWPGTQASPGDVKDALVHVRARLDSLESVLSAVMMLKAGSAGAARDAERAADDAWNRQAEAERHRVRPEYQGSRERYAYWELAIRAERARAREARDLADYVRGAFDVIKLAYDGLNETRRDLASRLTHLRWETHLEQ
jgi:hypothetical protein